MLLLDNAADRGQVEPLLPPVGCLLLITSRQRFNLPGLIALDVPTLSNVSARELLLKAAPDVSDLADSADEIARLVGYLPLALRLAAGALDRPDLSAHEYVQRLCEGGELKLSDGTLSIDVVIGLSHNRLDPRTQRLFSMLSVFHSGWDRAAARAVWDVDENAADDVLGELLRRSMLEWEQGHEWAESGLLAARKLQDRVAMAVHLRRVGWKYMLSEPDRALTNYEESLKLSRDLEDQRSEAIVLRQIGELYAHKNELEKAIENHESSLSIARDPRVADRRAEINALGSLGGVYMRSGELSRAIEHYEKAVALEQQVRDMDGELNDSRSLGRLYIETSQFERAFQFLEQALWLQHALRLDKSQMPILSLLTIAAKEMEAPTVACLDYCRQLIDVALKGRELSTLLTAFESLATMCQKTGQASGDVLGASHSTLELVTQIVDDQARLKAFASLGLSLYHCELQELSVECLNPALLLARQLGERRSEGNALGNLGCAYSELGEFERAVDCHQQALNIDRELEDRAGEAQGSWDLGETCEKMGKLAEAADLMQVRVNYLHEIAHPEVVLKVR